MEFEAFPKIPRLTRDCVITEKIDGTNGQILITHEEAGGWGISVGSRNRWLSAKEDNHGFFKWVWANRDQICQELGEGRHFGEWWGAGINKRYPGAPKKFSLFNAPRWQAAKAEGLLTVCDVTPILYEGVFSTFVVDDIMKFLDMSGSRVWAGCRSEGIVIYHKAGGYLFKKTLDNDESPKQASTVHQGSEPA